MNTTLVLQFVSMRYGERLKIARMHAGLSQAELAARAKVGTQEGVSKLERTDAEGSEFTVQYATACGVRPEWLAMEEGEMVDGLYVHDEKLKRALVLLQSLPDYAVDQAVKDIASITELVRKASSGQREDNSDTNPTQPPVRRKRGL